MPQKSFRCPTHVLTEIVRPFNLDCFACIGIRFRAFLKTDWFFDPQTESESRSDLFTFEQRLSDC
jgi:hypothetical protein